MFNIFLKYLIPVSLLLGFVNTILSKIFCDLDRCTINTGISFGISILFIEYISVLVILIIFIIGIRLRNSTGNILISISILGFSNLISRLIFNGIADYIHLLNISFNIVDIFIVLFSLLLISQILRGVNKKDRKHI